MERRYIVGKGGGSELAGREIIYEIGIWTTLHNIRERENGGSNKAGTSTAVVTCGGSFATSKLGRSSLPSGCPGGGILPPNAGV